MAKRVTAKIKLQIPAGQANPSPPVGPALGQHKVNIMEFCKAFNERILLKRAAGIAKGSSDPIKEKVGKVNRKQIEDIAKIKLPDLNTKDLAAAMKTIEGTARSMGIQVVE